MPKTILLFDEVARRREFSAFGLRCAGYEAKEAQDFFTARCAIAQRCPDLLLLVASVMHDELYEFIATVRADLRTRELPLIVLVERDTESAAERAAELGIDDYMVEPVAPEALISRVRVALANREHTAAVTQHCVGLSLDDERGVVSKGHRLVALHPIERQILGYFLQHPDEPIARETLQFRIWGSTAQLKSRVIDTSICRLRTALKRIGCENLLQTVHGVGYRFVVHQSK